MRIHNTLRIQNGKLGQYSPKIDQDTRKNLNIQILQNILLKNRVFIP